MGFWSKVETRSRSNLYFALLLLDRGRREAFRDVYRFLRAADDVADGPGPLADRLAALASWRQELAALYDGEPAHPYARRLAGAVRRYRLSRRHFETLLDTLARDAAAPRLPDWPALEAHCQAVASSLAYLCLELLGETDEAAMAYGRDVGVALQLANVLRDLGEDAAAGRIYLPADELAAAGVSEAELRAGRFTAGLGEVARRQADRARALIASARARLSDRQRAALLVPEIWADVYLALLDELERAGFDVLGGRPYLRRRRKAALALRRWATVQVGRIRAAWSPQSGPGVVVKDRPCPRPDSTPPWSASSSGSRTRSS